MNFFSACRSLRTRCALVTGVQTCARPISVVANAAIVRDRPFDEMTSADFDDVIDVNLRGVMRVLHPAFKVMKAGGGGRMVAVTSSSGMLGDRKSTRLNSSH